MEPIFRENHRLWMITIYLILVAAFLYIRPSVAFGEKGRIRPFGTSREATVFPLWWWIFIIAVLAYGITLFGAKFRFSE
jgi:hypothetical protein